MEKYIAEKKISFSATEEQEFRNLLNRWSKSEEGYESRPIGKDVKIVPVMHPSSSFSPEYWNQFLSTII